MMSRLHQLLTAALLLLAAHPGCGAPTSGSAQKPSSAEKPANDVSVDLTEEASATIVVNDSLLPYPSEKMNGPSLDECDADHVGTGFVAVSFNGNMVWSEQNFPESLPKSTSLTIEVQDATTDEMEDRPILFVYHTNTTSAYVRGQPLPYAFCAKIPDNRNVTQYGLHAHLNLGRMHVEGGTSRLESYVGLTEVESGIDEYSNVRVRMFPVVTMEQTVEDGSSEGASGAGHRKPAKSKYDASCNFSSVKDEGLVGVATEVSVTFPSELDPANLPKPTYLTVRMDDISTDEDEPQAVAVFTSDLTKWYKEEVPLTALLCAKLPDHGESIMYRVIALLNVGWDGYTTDEERDAARRQEKASEETKENAADDEVVQTLRNGDFVGTTMVVVLPDKVDYTASAKLEPYKSTE
ncbi:hypothetical protein TGARI_316890 [Toxoplasma gondii ARI]|uniref:Uncharacterized protein n=1 Tax=Toxoplasma gondii ARI TaxID=1074872 RepID=A0A139XNH8_TOXGO|nr:hypothetical protein TGARI_316890 [Toxoplasma gondii ARI]